MEPPPAIRSDLETLSVYEIHGGFDDGAELVFDFDALRIDLSIFPSSSSHNSNHNSTQDRLINLLSHSIATDVDDGTHEELLDEALRIILDAGRTIFRAHAAHHAEPNRARPLHSVLYPTFLYFQVIDDGEKARIVPISPDEAYNLPTVERDYDSAEEDELGIEAALPCYLTREISTTMMLLEGASQVACQVLVNDQTMFCKAVGRGVKLRSHSVGRKLVYLDKVLNSFPPAQYPRIRIPQLLGYVRNADNNRVVGFLREWISGDQLRDINISAISVQKRQRWMDQISDTVRTLHTKAIVWGDGMASNVIIDEQDNAWLIDSEGGWTNGGVDEELPDTLEGDEQAIDKIKEFLKL